MKSGKRCWTSSQHTHRSRGVVSTGLESPISRTRSFRTQSAFFPPTSRQDYPWKLGAAKSLKRYRFNKISKILLPIWDLYAVSPIYAKVHQNMTGNKLPTPFPVRSSTPGPGPGEGVAVSIPSYPLPVRHLPSSDLHLRTFACNSQNFLIAQFHLSVQADTMGLTKINFNSCNFYEGPT